MSENVIEVHIVKLPAMRVISTYGFGERPEPIAWDKMSAFVKTAGLNDDGQEHRYFGFNNPNPAPGTPNYGYEQWVTVSPETLPTGDAQVKEFPGGPYAVTRCSLATIGTAWEDLFHWAEKSPYRIGSHQWLEESKNPPVTEPTRDLPENQVFLDLYLPIIE